MNVAESKERDATRRLGESQDALQRHEAKLEELQAFLNSYTGNHDGRDGSVLGAAQLNDYRAFLGRLNEAIRHQERVIEDTRRQCEAHRQHWFTTRRRVKALQEVVNRYRSEERRQAERREQSEMDGNGARQIRTSGIFNE